MLAELQAELERLGQRHQASRSRLAAVHRGWNNLEAAMIIGAQHVENVELSEVARGDRAILQAYERASGADLPDTTRQLIQRQCLQANEVARQIDHLRGASEGRLVVRLVDRPEDVQRSIQALTGAGFSQADMETLDVSDTIMAGR